MPALAATHRVVALDLPRQGHSDRPADGYDTLSVARLVRRAVELLGVGEHWLVAHDVGHGSPPPTPSTPRPRPAGPSSSAWHCSTPGSPASACPPAWPSTPRARTSSPTSPSTSCPISPRRSSAGTSGSTWPGS
ncbi:alpha/beta fold hydrolase [Pseudonocardia sp. EV170527-09]|uniref:alpha/beta fold hydrolase n=1 Tax=Pseudonocardia sp. EV170527-09 TaxID=2603411 RepID=UPI001F00328F|nr:alpha/beta fold hydrolase [Pseudonocardia sp. EV170527-09]